MRSFEGLAPPARVWGRGLSWHGLVLVAHEDELGLEAIREFNVGVGQDFGSASAFPDLAVYLKRMDSRLRGNDTQVHLRLFAGVSSRKFYQNKAIVSATHHST